ncbi:hypothetical protein PLESTB_000905800 [Pleodorina starrii]|uniref:Serine aminopeptidase S33 domain-containing protein n=1 Tax=Pleodorina starrii TaxID=330485 RepID=A0A9W6BNX1_9CHLO|nr:hypothetical protein PLESTM_001517400 [Pleodorina starrii]GLC54786.1 hypothetical protein PLESTB_000905800 [Pleodorina starrii]GLC68391.1 hypothetical protein PLESTF_000686000 [Pleodorina starrii]
MAPLQLDLSTQPTEDYLGPHGSTRMHTNKSGMSICQYYWPAAPGTKPKGILVLAHGHGCYLQFDWLRSQGPGKHCVYEGSFVQQLNAAGYAVCGNDNRGAGRSSGLRCYCDSFDDYVSDLMDVARTCTTLGIASFEEGLPKFVSGMSKGGCVALTAALTEPAQFSGVVCLAPMVSLEKVAKKGLNPYLRPLGSLLSLLIPRAALLSTDRNTMYPDLQAAYDVDPNCYHFPTRVRNAQEYLKATERLVANQSKLRLPLLLFHAEGDTMTDPQGTKRLYEAAESPDKTFVSPPNMWHVLLKEPGHQEVERRILHWLDQRTEAPAGQGLDK